LTRARFFQEVERRGRTAAIGRSGFRLTPIQSGVKILTLFK
jgi:hypothetical protein